MSPEIEQLISLEQSEREIQRLRLEIAELPQRVAAIEKKLAGTKAALEKARLVIKENEAARRKHEAAIQDLRQKISKYRDQSLEVKTNEQYKALVHEIQFAEQEITRQEDRILELMVGAEEAEKQLKASEAELKAETAEIEKEKAAARERTAEDERQLTDWATRRNGARAAIDPELLRHYDRVLKLRGSGLAEVLDHKCMACSVVLRPQTYNEVRSGQLVHCDSCQRILYFDPAKHAPTAPSEKNHRRRPHPKIDASQAWYYRSDYADQGEVFLSFSNHAGMASRRVYDAASGRKLGETLAREGNYRQAFPEDLAESVRLNGNWSEDEQEGWGEELPSAVLDVLQRDLDLARKEAHHHPKLPAEASSTVAS